MKRKLLLACCALLIGWSNAMAAEIAWTDKTSLITNPSFETDDAIANLTTCGWATDRASGWTITPASASNAQVGVGNSSSTIQGIGTTFTPAAGDKYFYLRENWNENTTFSVSQTIGSANLPAGFYRVTCKAATSSSNEGKSKFTLTIQEGEGDKVSQSGIILNVWHDWGAIIFKTSDATDLKITASMLPGAQAGSQHYCMLLDDFQLSYISASDAYTASESNFIDFSALINNAGIYNAVRTSMPKGWTAYKSTRGNSNFTDGTGDCRFEGWSGGNLDIDFYQQINNLPSGKYSLTASGHREQGSANNIGRFYEYTAGADKAYSVFFANAAEQSDYSTSTLTVTNGAMNIGVEATTSTGAWVTADNFRIYFKGFDVSAKASELSDLLDDAAEARDAATYVNVVGTERTALQNAITTYTTGEEQSYGWYLTAISAVQTALNNFTAAKKNYDALVTEIAKAKALGIDDATADSYAATSSSTAATALTSTQDLKVAEYNYVTTTYQYGVSLGEWTTTGPTGSKSEQHWSGESRTYLEQSSAAWASGSWTIKYDQNLTLPAGNYVFKVAGRQAASDGVTLSLTVKKGESVIGTVSDFPKGDTGKGIDKSGATNFGDGEYANSNKGRGWEWRYVKFTLDSDATVNVAVDAVATQVNMWVSFCDATVQTDDDANISLIAYNIALNDANTAINNDSYTNVKGSEKTALQAAIDADEGLDKTDADAIEAATTALDNARVAFTNAKTSYDTYVAAKAVEYEDNLPYASSAKFAAIGTAQAAADATSASDAVAKTNAIISAYRKYVESNALAEGVGGIDKTNLITDANFSGVTIVDQTAGAWAFSQTGGTASIYNSESFTDGDGNANYSYFDYNNNGANNQNLSQTLTALPKGQYLLTVTARATTAMAENYYLSVDFDETSAKQAIPAIGNTGGTFGRGWNDVSVVFNHVSDGDVTIHVYGENGKKGWSGATRFRLAKIGEVVSITASGYATFSSASALDLTTANTPEGLEAYYVGSEGVKDTYVSLTAINQTVVANEGILFKGTVDAKYVVSLAASGTALEGNQLVVADGSAVDAGNYVFAFVDEDPSTTAGFYRLTTETAIPAGKAYLSAAAFSNVKAFLPFDGTATGVEVPEVTEAEEEEILYNTAGVRVDKNYKGIVINQKGEKFLNK